MGELIIAYSGKFIPENKRKYKGNWNKITFRSSWERKVMSWCDLNPLVLMWNSEDVIIPYRCRTDGQMHKYYMDFWVKIKAKDGTIQEKLIEVKPYDQTIKPVYKPGTSKKNFNRRLYAYAKNISKWEATMEWIKNKNMEFHILTERQLGVTLGPSMMHKSTNRKLLKRVDPRKKKK